MASPTIEDFANTTFSFGGTTGPFTCTLGAAPNEGDLLVLYCSSEAGGNRYPGAAYNSGWTQLYAYDDDDGWGTILYKFAGPSEPAAQNFYLGQNFGSGEATLVRYSGAGTPGTPQSYVGAAAYSAGTITGKAVTIGDADSLAILSIFTENPEGGAVSPPVGYSEIAGVSNTGSTHVAYSVPGTGSTGDQGYTGYANWWGTTVGVHGVMFEIPPSATSGVTVAADSQTVAVTLHSPSLLIEEILLPAKQDIAVSLHQPTIDPGSGPLSVGPSLISVGVVVHAAGLNIAPGPVTLVPGIISVDVTLHQPTLDGVRADDPINILTGETVYQEALLVDLLRRSAQGEDTIFQGWLAGEILRGGQ